jgi:hypothetical protein
LEENEREGNREGSRLEKGKRAGGIGQKAIFYLSNRTEAGEGQTARPVRAAPVIVGASGLVAVGGREKRRGGRGLPIPVLTLVGDGL